LHFQLPPTKNWRASTACVEVKVRASPVAVAFIETERASILKERTVPVSRH
jgi:hypothetical protein